MEYEMIVACTQKGVIGNKNTIPWHIPEDLKHFRKLTEHNIIVMGRKTFESLPKLKNRVHVVITRQDDLKGTIIANMNNVFSVLEKIKEEEIKQGREGKIFIIGGGEIYKLFFGLCKRLHLTIVNKDIQGDTYFPIQDINLTMLPETSVTNKTLETTTYDITMDGENTIFCLRK